ncbi:MAG: helix-turn-helix domain-containing protein [Lachnospiraceae bacterium]|nr:helix-turn-helix domain-containing protein [Lachnospiraceae bacterium]
MKTKRKNNKDARLLPFCVIKAATKGDILAIHKVLNHYEGYITSLSARRMKDKSGNIHYCVDETLRQRLQTKLLMTILNFKLIR